MRHYSPSTMAAIAAPRSTAAQSSITTPPPPSTSNNNSYNDNGFSSQHQRPDFAGPPAVFMLTSAPRRVPVVFLSEPWTVSLFGGNFFSDGWCASHMCCFRSHLFGQWDALNSVPTVDEQDDLERDGDWEALQNFAYTEPMWLRPLVLCSDVLTLGTPCGAGWSGCGSLVFGCHVRTEIRKKYHLLGNGLDDSAIMGCCPMFATRQHQLELLNHQSVYHDIPFHGSSDRML